jgi:hypothetical protein
MIQPVVIFSLLIALSLSGCNQKESGGAVVTEAHVPGDSSVAFELEPVQSGDGSRQWIGTYASPGKIARFRMDFGPTESVPGKNPADPKIESGEGTLQPEPTSDSSVLLADLQKALHAKSLPVPAEKKTSVPFTYVKIGDNLSQTSGGGFSKIPPGNWTSMKLIFGPENKEGEVFLNINPNIRKGQFSMKDPDSGDRVLVELAKVL